MWLRFIAAVPVLIWIYLLAARGGFWRVRRLPAPSAKWAAARVAVVIPARDEAEVIGQAIASLLGQDFPAPLHIFLVDDSSSDGTADVALRTAKQAGRREDLTVITSEPLPAGWTGKLWAMNQGVSRAIEWVPDYLLFTDADIVHSPENVAELVSIAEAQRLDLASYMVKLACETTAEKALIPAFVFFFLKLYPPTWISSSRMKTAGAAGGCILIRPRALQDIGGLAAIRGEVIDDCALARGVKGYGGRIWLGLTPDTHSIRNYVSFAEIRNMISRTAFNQLQHSTLLLIGTVLGLFLTYLLPPLLVLTGRPWLMLFGGLACLLMSVAYWPTVRFYNRAGWWCLALPLIATFYLAATFHSALRYWRGVGGQWKGRVQDTH